MRGGAAVNRFGGALTRAKGVLGGFTTGQKAVVVVVSAAMIVAVLMFSRLISQPSMAPLFGGLSGEDANAITEELTTQGVKYELADGGRTVLVPQEQVYDLRIAMAGAGLPENTGEEGYSLLDQQGITATDFQQNVTYRRALEGELNKTLLAMDGVQSANVHLALPQKDVFATEEEKPTASVLLGLDQGTSLDNGQVQAVTRLVAGSVEGLDPKNVTVSDSAGHLLTDSTGAGAGAGAANAVDEQTAKYEDRLSAAAQKMLDPVVGVGKSAVRVNATLNFDSKDTTSESYPAPSPSATVPPSSESTTTEQFTGDSKAAGGTLGSTLPSLTPNNANGNSGNYTKQERTVNNNVGKVVERVVGTPGKVERLTVSVVLDQKAAGGVSTAQVQQIVANAVGLDAARGDAVQVDALPFDSSASAAAQKALAEEQKAATMAGYIGMAKKAGLWLLALLVLFVLFRKGKKKNADDDASLTATASDLPEGLILPPGMSALDVAQLQALPSGRNGDADRERMRQEVAELVDNQPDDVAAMLQGWLDERASA